MIELKRKVLKTVKFRAFTNIKWAELRLLIDYQSYNPPSECFRIDLNLNLRLTQKHTKKK